MLLIAFTLLSSANAWWDHGHMMVAEVARQQLTSQQLTHLDEILKDFSLDYPAASDVVTASLWPDLIKCSGTYCRTDVIDNMHIFDNWHFNGRPYNPDNMKLPAGSNNNWQNNPSALYTMTSGFISLGSSNSRFTHNFFIRWLLHVVGDIHQPLHSCDGYFDNDRLGHFPFSDLGGNRIPIQSPCANNLHAYWDSGACSYVVNWSPQMDAVRKQLTANATALVAKYPKTSPAFAGRYVEDELHDCWNALLAGRAATVKPFDVCKQVFLSWSNDTFNNGVERAYAGITRESPIPDDYAAWVKEFSEQQFVLAGYRLGGLLQLVASRSVMSSPGAPDPPGQWTLAAKLFAILSLLLAVLVAMLLRSVLKLRRNLVEVSLVEGIDPHV